MDPISDITGVILAGGQSSRFGSNKALALLRGKPLIQHIADTIGPVFEDILLVTNSPEEYGFLNIQMIQDVYQDMGPLAGIHAALKHTGKQWIFVVGCDMPLVTPGIITFLCGLAHGDHDAVIPWLKTGAEPLCGLYRKTDLNRMELQLKNNKPQLHELLGNISVRKVKEEEIQAIAGSLKIFANINIEQDLAGLT